MQKTRTILHIGLFACFYAITFERSTFTKIASFKNQACVAIKPYISLFSRLVARNVVTDRQTHTQDNYRNPRACAPRVNYTSDSGLSNHNKRHTHMLMLLICHPQWRNANLYLMLSSELLQYRKHPQMLHIQQGMHLQLLHL